MPGSRIFISYRRGTSSAHAGRLADRLAAEFGSDYVFMDVDTIEPGADFVDYIQDAVGSCDVLVAVIGEEWLEARDQAGNRRLEDPEDFVRLEVAAGLERDIRVVPVLVEGAVMPRAQDLPAPLERLARRNALEVTDTRWRHDVGRLVETIHKVLEGTRPSEAIEQSREPGSGPAVPGYAAPAAGAVAAGRTGLPAGPAAPAGPASAEQPPEQAGVQPPMANLLSYLFLGIGGLIVFLTQRDREIRFHAVQSMLLAAAEIVVLLALALVFGIVLAVLGASTASGSYLLEMRVEGARTTVIGVVALLFLGVQAFLCVQGYRLRHTKLPVLGDQAERWTGTGAR